MQRQTRLAVRYRPVTTRAGDQADLYTTLDLLTKKLLRSITKLRARVPPRDKKNSSNSSSNSKSCRQMQTAPVATTRSSIVAAINVQYL